MNTHRKCIVCEHLNTLNPEDKIEKHIIYDHLIPYEFLFCYSHSVDLYLFGQRRFLEVYSKKILENNPSSNHPKFIDFLRKHLSY